MASEAQRKRTIETLQKIDSQNLVSTILVPNDNERSMADQWRQIVEQNKQRVIDFIFNHNTNYTDNTIAYDYIEIPHDLLSLVGLSSISSITSNKMSNKIHKILIIKNVSKFCQTQPGKHWKKKRLRIGDFEFKLHLYPNGLTDIQHAGFVQYFVELTKLPHDVQSIALFMNLFCTETNTKYKKTQLFHDIGDTQGWIWSLSTAKCLKYDSLQFGAYLEILQIHYNHSNKIEDLSTNIAINNINSYIWEWSEIRGILYEIKHTSHPHRSAFFSENTDDNMFCFVLESHGSMDNKHISIQCNLLRLPLGVEQISVLFTANLGGPNTSTLSYRSSVCSLKLIQEDVACLLSSINSNNNDSNDEVSLVLSVEILDHKTKETKTKKSRKRTRPRNRRKKVKQKYDPKYHKFMECWLQLNECLDRYYKYNKKQLNDKWLQYISEHQYNECIIATIIANAHCKNIMHWNWELLHFDDEFPIDNTIDNVLINITQRQKFISYILSYCYMHNKRPDYNEMEEVAQSITNSDTELIDVIKKEISLKVEKEALCTSDKNIEERQAQIDIQKQRFMDEECEIDKIIKELQMKKDALKTKQKELEQQQRDICVMNKENEERKKELDIQQKQFQHNKEIMLTQDKLSAKQRKYEVSIVRDVMKKQNELKYKIQNELNDYFVKKTIHQNGNIDDEDIKHMMDGVQDGIDHEANVYNYDEWFTEEDSVKRNGYGNSWICAKCEFVNDKIMMDGEWRYNNMRTDCALCGYTRDEYANSMNNLWKEASDGQLMEEEENDEDAYELIRRMENIADDILRETIHETVQIKSIDEEKNGYSKVKEDIGQKHDDEITATNEIPKVRQNASTHDLDDNKSETQNDDLTVVVRNGSHAKEQITNSVSSDSTCSHNSVSKKKDIKPVTNDVTHRIIWDESCVSLQMLCEFLQNISISQKESIWNKHAVKISNGSYIPKKKLLDAFYSLLCLKIEAKSFNKEDVKKKLSTFVGDITQRADINRNGISLRQFNHELCEWIAEGIKKQKHICIPQEIRSASDPTNSKQSESKVNVDDVKEAIHIKTKPNGIQHKHEHKHDSKDVSVVDRNSSNVEIESILSKPKKNAVTKPETDKVNPCDNNKPETDKVKTNIVAKDAFGDKQDVNIKTNVNKIEDRHNDIKTTNNVSPVEEKKSNKSTETKEKKTKNKKAKQKNHASNKPKKSKNKAQDKAVKSNKSSKPQKTQQAKAKKRRNSPEIKEKKTKHTKSKNTTKSKKNTAKDRKIKNKKHNKCISAKNISIKAHTKLSSVKNRSRIHRVDEALARYYAHHARKYWNEDGSGKFYQFCEENGYDTDGVEEEFEEDPTECLLVEFDEDFPTKKKDPERSMEIFLIVKHCWDDAQAFIASAHLPKQVEAPNSSKKKKEQFTEFENIVFGDMIKLYHIAQKLQHMEKPTKMSDSAKPSQSTKAASVQELSTKASSSKVPLTTNHEQVNETKHKSVKESEAPPKSHCAKIMDLVIGAVPTFQSPTNSKETALKQNKKEETKQPVIKPKKEEKKKEENKKKEKVTKKEDEKIQNLIMKKETKNVKKEIEKEAIESYPEEEEEQEALVIEAWEPEEAEMLCLRASHAVHSAWNKEQYGILIREREEFLKQYDMKWMESVDSSRSEELDEKCMDLQKAIVHDYTKKEIECLLTIEIIHKHFIYLVELKQKWSEIEAKLRVINRKDLRVQMMRHLDFFVRIEQDMMKRKSFESLQSEVVMFMINIKSTKTECEKCIQTLDEIEKINDKVIERHERKKRFHQQFRNLNLYQKKKSSAKQKKKAKEKEVKEVQTETKKDGRAGVLQILDEIRTDRLDANIREIVKEDRFRIEIDDGFVNIHSGTRYVGEKCHIEQFYFNLYLYPNGRSRSEKGYVQFVIKFEMPQHIKSMVIYCKFFEKKTSTEYNTTQMIERGNGTHIAWDPCSLSTKTCIKHKQLLFGYRIQIIQIHHCINNKISDHCKDKVFGDGIYRWEMDKNIVSFIKQNIGRNPILFYIQHPTKKCISFSFKANPNRKSIYLSLNLFKLPPKIEKIKLLLQITSSCNKVDIKKEKEHVFDYKHTQLTVELSKKQTDALLIVAKQQKLCLIFRINIKKVWFREFMDHPWCLDKFFGINGEKEDVKNDNKSQTKNTNTTTRNVNSNKNRNNKKRNNKKRNVSKSNRKK